MARIPKHKDVDFCFNPIRVKQDDGVITAPCGKCAGCRLQKANEWSLRLASEIEASPCCLFFTLTYSNEYLPVLDSPYYDNLASFDFATAERLESLQRKLGTYHSWHSRVNNPRCVPVFDKDNKDLIIGRREVPREDWIFVRNYYNQYSPVDVSNWHDIPVIPYLSKRDLQLYFKLLRQHLYLHYGKSIKFRYFTFSEYGETRFRPHHHVLLFPPNMEISEFLFRNSLYQNWQMCDESIFYSHDNVKYVKSGISEYLTNYATSYSYLPSVYQLDKLAPFRLASKNPAIGFRGLKKEEVFENVGNSVIEFTKVIPRNDRRYVLEYPKIYISSLFPKCYRFSQLDFHGLYMLYGFYCFIDRLEALGFGVYSGLFETLDIKPQDRYAAYKCREYVNRFHSCVFHYVFMLDNVYYKKAMSALRSQFTYQEQHGFSLDVARTYSNFYEYLLLLENDMLGKTGYLVLSYFLEPLNISVYDLKEQMTSAKHFSRPLRNEVYENEVLGILQNMVKIPKFNEQIGTAPQCQSN